MRQLTLLDSPESDNSDITSPVAIDAANYDWFYLSQLNTAQPVAVSGTVKNGQATVTVSSTKGLVAGMGVTGTGVPVGTKINTVETSNTESNSGQIVLSNPVNDTSVPINSSVTLNFGVWNWSNDAIFVDSYDSYYGTGFSNVATPRPR